MNARRQGMTIPVDFLKWVLEELREQARDGRTPKRAPGLIRVLDDVVKDAESAGARSVRLTPVG